MVKIIEAKLDVPNYMKITSGIDDILHDVGQLVRLNTTSYHVLKAL